MKTRLFVGNFPYPTTERELEDHFAAYGVTDLLICRDPGGFSKGFAFLFVEELEGALAENERGFNGRRLRVSIARDTSRDLRRRAAAGVVS